jgi:hypothetical protein
LSMYSMSVLIQSSKLNVRSDTCQRQVMPGLTLKRRLWARRSIKRSDVAHQ